MTRKKLNRYKRDKKQLKVVNATLERLYTQLSNVEIVAGKVSKSTDDFPYIESHVTVEMQEPKSADKIKVRIRENERRRERIEKDIREVEQFIEGLPDGIGRQIAEMVFFDGMSQAEAAELVGYTQSMVSKIIKGLVKDS